MTANTLYVDNTWDWTKDDSDKPVEQRFFNGYARAVDSRTFGTGSMLKWYSSHVEYRSETGKVFHGADEMKAWMADLFFKFEKINHVPEYYLQYGDGEALKVHMGVRRQLWLKGNTGTEPDVDTPLAWVCEIGPADEPEGYLGLQFKAVNLYWDKAKTVALLQQRLPSDT